MKAPAAPNAGAHRALLRASVVLGGATVLAHVAYPLTDGEARRLLTIWSVVAFCACSVAHVSAHHGLRGAASLLGAGAGIGWAMEAIGVATGFPFGRYEYADTLGWKLVDVVVIVPLAWAMMAWPALVAGRRTGHPVLAGAAILVTWDLFLDPQMVDAGHWTWAGSRWPALHAIPVSNAFGWALTATLVLGVLHRCIPVDATGERRLDERVPLAMLGWTWASSVLAFPVFFGRPSVSLVAGPAMAIALLPTLRGLRRDPPAWLAGWGRRP